MNEINWKWWHYIVVGVLICAFSGWQIWNRQINRGVGGLLLAAICIGVGLVMRKSAGGKKE